MGLRSRSRRTRKAAQNRGKRGGGAFFSDEIRIEKKHQKSPGVPMLIIPAEYETPITDESGDRDPAGPFFPFLQGLAKIEPRGGKMQLRSDAIPKAWPIPDDDFPADDPRVYDPDKEDKPVSYWHHLKQAGDNRVGFSIQNALNVIDLREHVEVEKKDKDGNTITFKRGDKQGQPIMERIPYDPKEHKGSDLKVLPGRKGYTKVGNGHRTQIEDLELEFEDHCRSCQQGTIEVVELRCPETDEVLVDLIDGDFSDEDVSQFLDKGMYSEAAKKNVYPVEVIECDNCDAGARATLYDVVVFLKKSGEGTNSAVSMKTKSGGGWVWLTDFELPDGEKLVTDYETEERDDGTFVNVYEFHPDIKEMMTPYDFAKVPKIGVPGMKNSYLAAFLGHKDIPEEYDDGNSTDSGGGSNDRDDDSGGNSGGRRTRRGGGNDSRRRSSGNRY